MSIRRFLRSQIDRSPALASTLRSARDRLHWSSRRLASTPYGFLFAGNPGMQQGTFEQEEVSFLIRMLSNFDVLIDIGANIGLFTCLALQNGKNAIAFEPLPANISTFCRNLAANGWSAEIWPIGLSNKAGIALLYGGNTGASLVKGWGGTSENWSQPVPIHTLDSILGTRLMDKRLFVKLDVEGAEFDVLSGATTLITRGAIWLVEITLNIHRRHPNENFLKTFELFWSQGYTCTNIKGDLVTPSDVARWVNQGEVDSDIYNFVFIR